MNVNLMFYYVCYILLVLIKRKKINFVFFYLWVLNFFYYWIKMYGLEFYILIKVEESCVIEYRMILV